MDFQGHPFEKVLVRKHPTHYDNGLCYVLKIDLNLKSILVYKIFIYPFYDVPYMNPKIQ